MQDKISYTVIQKDCKTVYNSWIYLLSFAEFFVARKLMGCSRKSQLCFAPKLARQIAKSESLGTRALTDGFRAQEFFF
jgi:hypothetical protein